MLRKWPLRHIWSNQYVGVLLQIAFLLHYPLLGHSRQHLATVQQHKNLAELSVDNWTTDDGLSTNTLLNVVQSPDGYLWLASFDGLIRFDGMHFEKFSKHNTDVFQTNVAFAIIPSIDSTLWIGTHGSGLLSYKNGVFRAHGKPELMIQSLLPDDRGRIIWVGTREYGCLLYNAENNTWAQLSHPALDNATVNQIIKDQTGAIWIATNKNGVISYKNGNFEVYGTAQGLEAGQVRCVYADHRNQIWLGTDKGAYLIEHGRIKKMPYLNDLVINCFFESDTKSIWMGTSHGLVKIHKERKELEFLKNRWGHRIMDIYNTHQDREGNIWIASYRHGLFRLKDSNFSNFNYATDGMLPTVTAICEHPQGGQILGTAYGQLYRLHHGEVTPMRTQHALSPSKIYDLYVDSKKQIWVSAYVGLLKISPNGKETFFDKFGNIPHQVIIKTMLEDRNHHFWVGTINDGILEFDEQMNLVGSYHKLNGLGTNYIMSLRLGPEGLIYAGTNDIGICIIDPVSKQVKYINKQEHGLISNLVFSTQIDEQGNIWVPTNGGISRISPTGEIFNIGKAQGLPYESPFDFVIDGSNHAWMPGSQGIMRVSLKELNAMANSLYPEKMRINWDLYDQTDGINYAQCTGASFSHLDSEGFIWVPNMGGVVRVNTHKVAYNAFVPPVHIVEMVVDDAPVSVSSPAVVPANAKRYNFRFTALSYISPSKVRFKYRLDGHDQDWIDAGNKREATYTNLPPGQYTFHVIASNNDGVWNYDGDQYTFTRKAHFYQTPWFFFWATLAIIFAARAFYNWRILSIKQRSNELEMKVLERTEQILEQKQEIKQQNEKLSHQQLELLTLNEQLKVLNSTLEEKVTERTRALQQAIDQLTASNSELETFINQAPHDLRGPIARILGIVELIRMEAMMTGKVPPYLEHLQHVALNMDSMLGKLLKVYDIVTHVPQHEVFCFSELFDDVLGHLGKQYPLDNYSIALSPSSPLQMDADRELVSIVVEYLLENALVFSAKLTERKPVVAVHIEERGGGYHFVVHDNGIGIPASIRDDIWKTFFKGSELSEGNGMGLYLVRKALDQLRGTVEMSSEVGKFTEFRVFIPRA